MLTYRVGSAGDLASAKDMVDYLSEETMPKEMLDMATYYQRGMEPNEQGQTTAEPRRDMRPEVAAVFGIDQNQALNNDEIACVLSGRRIDGSDIPGRAKRRITENKGRNGYIDLCFSADKSVSVAWAFAKTESERAIIMQAHRDAVDSAMRYIEKEIAWAHKGDGGRFGADRGHLGWIKFDHYTSRPTLALKDDGNGNKSLVLAKDDDPAPGGTMMVTMNVPGDMNIHTHVAVPNMVLTEEGRVGSIDFNRLDGRIKEFGSVYQAFLATNLRRSGVKVELDEQKGSARVTAIPDHVRDAFSKRTRDAHETARQYAKENGIDWDSLTPEDKIKHVKGSAKGNRQAKQFSDVEAWHKQAEALGWRHTTVIDQNKRVKPMAHENRIAQAHTASLRFVEADFTRHAVISAFDIRTSAARGLIASGIESDEDINAVTKLMRDVGVRQNGKQTDLMWGKAVTIKGIEQVHITTRLHVRQEEELVNIARKGAADKSKALDVREINDAAQRRGLDFSNDHGEAQRRMMEQLGTGGQVAVAVGAAGSGKSAILAPLVDVWKSKGFSVYGAALAWRQSDDLATTGIEQDNRAALAAFLSRAKRGTIKLDEKSVVVVDELGLIGTRQALDLLRLQRDHGFKLVAVGDERQCQAIEAGPVIELMRRALGKEAVPEILTTIRQKTEREREISGLFRDGKAGMALGMKREDGTVHLVPGGYREAVERVADLWQERRDANAHDPNFTISISAPSNADAREISAVLRARRQSKGEVSSDKFIISATDQHGAKYNLPLAVGDRVRLFDRVAASFGERGGIIGNNGSVLEIRKLDKDGIVLQTTTGLTGRVKWEALKDRDNERIRLSYGDVGTIDSLQGITSTEHIDALPAGSKSVQGFKAYVAESRHRQKSWMVTSDGAERQEIVDRRALGDPRPIRDEDIWENMARNLSRQPEKMAAMDFLDAAERFRNRATVSMQEGFQRAEQRDVDGLEPASLRHTVTREAEVEQVSKAVSGIVDVSEQRQKTLDTFEDRLHAFDAAMASVEKHIEDVSAEHLLQAMGAMPQAELPDAPDWADGAEETQASKPNGKHLRTPGRAKLQQIPKEHLEALKETVRISDLISQSVKLERAGHDFKACCPFHDERTPSFHVSDKKGTFTCYGCGEHGDALDWLKAQHGLKFHDAIKYLEDRSGITLPNAINVPRAAAQKEPEWKAVPVPHDAPPLIQPSGRTTRIYNPKRAGTDKEWGTYRPAHVASYQDGDGKQLGYVIRVEIKDKEGRKDRKFTPQVTWVVPANAPANADPAKVGRWALHPMPDPRPLYHEEMLKLYPNARVIVVAGEKKADALQKVLGKDAVVVSWAGGDNARQLVNFKPLAGRKVLVWPDADESGIAAAIGKSDGRGAFREGAATLIKNAGAAQIQVVKPPENVEKGWDCGDLVKSGANKAAILAFLKERSVKPEEIEQGDATKKRTRSRGYEHGAGL